MDQASVGSAGGRFGATRAQAPGRLQTRSVAGWLHRSSIGPKSPRARSRATRFDPLQCTSAPPAHLAKGVASRRTALARAADFDTRDAHRTARHGGYRSDSGSVAWTLSSSAAADAVSGRAPASVSLLNAHLSAWAWARLACAACCRDGYVLIPLRTADSATGMLRKKLLLDLTSAFGVGIGAAVRPLSRQCSS